MGQEDTRPAPLCEMKQEEMKKKSKILKKLKKIPNSFDDFSNGAIYILKGKV